MGLGFASAPNKRSFMSVIGAGRGLPTLLESLTIIENSLLKESSNQTELVHKWV